MKIVVLGSGSFGTAMAVHFAAHHEVVLWARRQELAVELEERRINERYLPGVAFPQGLVVTSDLRVADQVDLVVVAIPSHGFRQVLRELWESGAGGRQLVVSATKGIENESLARMSQVAAEVAAEQGREIDFAVFSGPSFAGELAQGAPTAAVIAGEDEETARRLQAELSSPTLRLYSSRDVAGVELCGAAKNIVAIAAGMATGLGFGQNTLAALITRGLHEISRLGTAFGGDPRTFAGLAGLGDLVLTCTGGASRNRRAGLALAEGQSLWELEAETGQIAEGVRTSLAIHQLAQRVGVEMPITEQIVDVIYHGKDPRRSVYDLMVRGLKSETER